MSGQTTTAGLWIRCIILILQLVDTLVFTGSRNVPCSGHLQPPLTANTHFLCLSELKHGYANVDWLHSQHSNGEASFVVWCDTQFFMHCPLFGHLFLMVELTNSLIHKGVLIIIPVRKSLEHVCCCCCIIIHVCTKGSVHSYFEQVKQKRFPRKSEGCRDGIKVEKVSKQGKDCNGSYTTALCATNKYHCPT